MVEWECPTNPREASGRAPEAVHIPAAEYNGGSGFYNSLRRPVPYRDPWALVASLDTRTLVVETGTAVVAGEVEDRRLFAAATGVVSPANVSYRATVTPEGLLRDQRLSYTGELFDTSVRVTRTIGYRPLERPVERPAWFETAKERSVRN